MIFATKKNIKIIRDQAVSEANREQWLMRQFGDVHERIDHIEKRVYGLEAKLNHAKNPHPCTKEDG